MNWKRLIGLSVMAMAVACGMTYSAEPGASSSNLPPPIEMKQPDPVKDCPTGLVCFTLAESADMDRALAILQSQLAVANLKRFKRFGWTAGLTLSVGPTLNQGVPGMAALAGVGVVYGIRW